LERYAFIGFRERDSVLMRYVPVTKANGNKRH